MEMTEMTTEFNGQKDYKFVCVEKDCKAIATSY